MATDAILKSVLKVGLEALSPIVGNVAAVALEEGIGLVLDRDAEHRAKDVHARLLKQLRRRAQEFDLRSEGLAAVGTTAETIIEAQGLRRDEWLRANLGGVEAAKLVLERSQGILSTLSPEEHSACRVLLEAFYDGMFEDREVLNDCEAEFRRALLSRLDGLADDISQASMDASNRLLDLSARALVELPLRRWDPNKFPPAVLLRADCDRGVPFHARESELHDLDSWCRADRPLGIRVYLGPGGIGKTRLFIELCSRLRARGWFGGFLSTSAESAPPELWSRLARGDDASILVVDYAETRRREVVQLLQELVQRRDGRVRVVLTARALDDWWTELKAEGGGVGDLLAGPGTTVHRLKPLAMTREDRQRSFQLAQVAFKGALDATPSRTDPADDIESRHFDRVLLLHLDALASLDDVPVKGEQGILDWALRRERGFWKNQRIARGLPQTVDPGLEQLMAVFTLQRGVSSERDALSLVETIPVFRRLSSDVQTGVVRLLHDCYPGERWIEPLLPDLLGEHLIEVATDAEPDLILDRALGPPDP